TLAQINGQGRRHRLSSSESRPSNHITAAAETLHDSIRSVTALGRRKLGWRQGALIDFNAQRAG
ncbi:hypothetical protein, partial [Methylobacterium sp. A52T]